MIVPDHTSDRLFPDRTLVVHLSPGSPGTMEPPPVELRILGHTELHATGEHTGSFVLRQPKRLALLAYLALATTGGYRRRDQLVALFWPELDQAHARTQLRKVLHALRSTIGADAIVMRGEEELRLDERHVWCDAAALQQQAEAGRWTEALALYRGELLEGLYPGGVGEAFETWLDEQRAALRALAARAAWEGSSRSDLAGQKVEALALARRAVELDPDDEEGIRRLIAVLDRYGDRAGALRVFDEWQARMQEEFGAEPAPETRRLARQVRAHRPGESADTPAALAVGAGSSGPEAALPVVRAGAQGATRRWARRRVLAPALIGALAAVATLGTLCARSAGERRVTGPVDPSVAVLPLRALGDSSDGRFGEGLAEELTIALNAAAGVAVRSTARAAESVRHGGDVERIGRRLGVGYLIDGAVQHDARRVRVTMRLVRVLDGVTLWSGAYDAVPGEPLESQERIARDVAAAVRGRLVPRPTGSVRR